MSDELDLDNLNMLKDLLGERFGELIETFLKDSSERVSLMTSGLGDADDVVVRHAAHGLKGSCRNIGANPLGDICAVLEDQATAGSIQDGQQQLAAIAQKLAAVTSELKALL